MQQTAPTASYSHPSRTTWLSRRLLVSSELVLLMASLAFTLFYNNAFWHYLGVASDLPAGAHMALFVSLILAVTCLQFAVLALVLHRSFLRPVLGLLFLCTAFASYFMDRFGVFINDDMLRNVLHTNAAEASELLTPALMLHVAVFGVLPLLLLWRVHLVRRPLRHGLAVRAAAITAAVAIALGALLFDFKDVSSWWRNHREARLLVTPMNYLGSMLQVVRSASATATGPRTVIAPDARRDRSGTPTGHRPQLLVLAVGETLRSANFGLSGYARQTTPELAQLDLVAFPRVQACGTSTEVSVPCLFAPVGRRDYDEQRIAGQQSLLHVLARVGFDVLWIDNQSGCKGVCEGLPLQHTQPDSDPALCDGERCLDEILIRELVDAVAENEGDLVVVLHMLGNHGPAYFRRYPPKFRVFTPACENLDFSACTREEIVNAYDNAVLYTDHVLASLVTYLQSVSTHDAGLIFVSDHGESLGENGIYLHGLPYRIAPAGQVEVPMVMWLSPGMASSTGVNLVCLKARAAQPVAHDHFFHSVLGLLQVSTTTRDPALDLIGNCS